MSLEPEFEKKLEAIARELEPVLMDFYNTLEKYEDLEYCEAVNRAFNDTKLDERIDEIIRKYLPDAEVEDGYLSDEDLSIALYTLDKYTIEIIMNEFNYLCELYKLRDVLPDTPKFTILVYEDGYLVKTIPI